MERKYRIATLPGHRICNRCERELPLTPEIFIKDASRTSGLAFECKDCHRARKKGRDRRKERWSNMTPDQRLRARARAKRYEQTIKGRAIHLRKAYERIDACDLSTDEVVEIIKQPCTYCGTTEENRGLDRIDNSVAHLKGNVVACCAKCNFARGDRLTMEEMMAVGRTIREIREKRLALSSDTYSTATPNEARL